VKETVKKEKKTATTVHKKQRKEAKVLASFVLTLNQP
jgi:hypothetical protein